MGYRVDNAIILAAGLSSRFAPISYEKPKALINVRGEVLIERQIRQLHEAGIDKVYVVVGYMKNSFQYLKEKLDVTIVENHEYLERNNHSSIYAAKEYIRNSYICSADNYFRRNPFQGEEEESYYSAVYAKGETKEWCIEADDEDWIKSVAIGGTDTWYMMGHVFWSQEFSKRFLEILKNEYDHEEIRPKLWETIYLEHIQELNLKIKRYSDEYIYEFDSLDELRLFDSRYISHSESKIMNMLSLKLGVDESEIKNCIPYKAKTGETIGFAFECRYENYLYLYKKGVLKKYDRDLPV